MSEYRRQHPLMIVQTTIRGLLQLIWLFLILFFSLSNLEQDFYAIYIVGGLFILSLVWAILNWFFFMYRLDDDSLHIRSGVIFKQERSIRKQRVQSVNVFTNILQQPFRVCRLQVKTAGSGTEVEFNLYSVKWDEAEHIKDALRGGFSPKDESQDTASGRTHRVDKKEMYIAGLTSGRFLVLFSLLIALYFQFSQFIPDDYLEEAFHQLETTPLHLLLMLILVILVISWLVSTIYFVIQYYDFNILRDEDTLHLSWGIIEEKKVTVKVERVQALSIRESPLRQLLGRCSLHMELAGGADKNQDQMKLLCPILARKDVDRFLLDILPEYSLPESMMSVPSRARKRYLIRAIIPALIIAITIHYMQVPFFYLVYLLIVPSLYLGMLRHKEAATAIMGSHLCLRFRYFSRLNVLVKKNHLQSMSLSANPMQRWSSLRSVSIAVLSSPVGESFTVKDVDLNDAEHAWRWYSRSR